MEFPVIGFKGKWLAFIGDPCPGFKAAVSGMPKMGKTYLCIDFADYLSKNHGKVLYVTKEEFSPTFALKLNEKGIGNENLDVAPNLPDDLSPYQFIFLDSVSSMKLSAEDLKKLEDKNPGKSFVYVFQVTKAGKARGTNEFMHNVDIIIEVPDKGKAVQYGRYNQGGELDIFSQGSSEHSPIESGKPAGNENELNGMKKKAKPENDWTKPEGFSQEDHTCLKRIYELHKNGKFKEAHKAASELETALREEIPPEVWKEIGGELTPNGEEKLRRKKQVKNISLI